MEKRKKEAIKLAAKINFYTLMLLIAYYLLGIVILKGELFVIGPLLYSLFSINCVVVGLKIYKGRKNGRDN